MNILIVSGSQRKQSNSFALAKHIQKNVLEHWSENEETSCTILELAEYSTLLEHYSDIDDNTKSSDTKLASIKEEVLSKLYACDAVAFIAPEWGGMVPPALINLLLLCANGSANGLPLGHKPAFAIGLSSAGGGANPIPLLKGFSAKNTHMAWLPLHAIVQNIDAFIAAPWTPENKDRLSQVQSRIDVGFKSLAIYANQLKPVRETLVKLSTRHPFGQ